MKKIFKPKELFRLCDLYKVIAKLITNTLIKKQVLFILCLLTFSFSFSQNYLFFKLKISDVGESKPIPFIEMCLCDDSVMQCVNSDFDGFVSFTTHIHKLDFLYLITCNNVKSINLLKDTLYLKKMNILKKHQLSTFYVELYEYKLLTQKEINKYYRKNALIPNRKKTYAKDVE